MKIGNWLLAIGNLLADLLAVLLMAMRSDFRREHKLWLDEGEAESESIANCQLPIANCQSKE